MILDERAKRAFDDVAYLCCCAVHEIKPDAERVCAMDLDQVYQVATSQSLASCCAFALESIGMCSEEFAQAKAAAIRRAVLTDIQRNTILERLESAGIWHMPLKGTVLKEVYPSIGMREMADTDILFDDNRVHDMHQIMVAEGFKAIRRGKGACDIYYKDPIYNFEMHRLLLTHDHGASLKRYYANVKERLQPDEGCEFRYHFILEDFYLFMVAHERKHCFESGIGIRSCLDTYVYLTRQQLDMDYVQRESRAMGIEEFEQINRSLSFHFINSEDLSEDELALLSFMYKSGSYGNLDAKIERKIDGYGGGLRGKFGYIINRIFIPMDTIKACYPSFYRYKVLLPLLPLVRFKRMMTVSRKKVIAELNSLRKS